MLSHGDLAVLAASEGLELIGIVPLGVEPTFGAFRGWLDSGFHAGMHFLTENQSLRQDPRGLLPDARAAMVLALPYYQGDRARHSLAAAGRIAQYARLRDYHRVFWERGEAILRAIAAVVPSSQGNGEVAQLGRVVADSAPLLERALAARAGGGFIGRHTCYIDRRLGSFVLLGEILTTLEVDGPSDLPALTAEADRPGSGCGTCRRCQVHCPTGALIGDGVLDANRCLAYWTIEHRGTIPEEFWPWIKDYLFGCDHCQLVCPFNRRQPVRVPAEAVRVPAHMDPYLLATMTQQDYERWFGGTPVTRAKRSGLVRNGLVAMAGSADPRLLAAIALIEARDDLAPVVAATLVQIRARSAS